MGGQPRLSSEKQGFQGNLQDVLSIHPGLPLVPKDKDCHNLSQLRASRYNANAHQRSVQADLAPALGDLSSSLNESTHHNFQAPDSAFPHPVPQPVAREPFLSVTEQRKAFTELLEEINRAAGEITVKLEAD